MSMREELEAGRIPRYGKAVDVARMTRELPAGDWLLPLIAAVYEQGHDDGESCHGGSLHAIVEGARSRAELIAGLRDLADDPGLEPDARIWEEAQGR